MMISESLSSHRLSVCQKLYSVTWYFPFISDEFKSEKHHLFTMTQLDIALSLVENRQVN